MAVGDRRGADRGFAVSPRAHDVTLHVDVRHERLVIKYSRMRMLPRTYSHPSRQRTESSRGFLDGQTSNLPAEYCRRDVLCLDSDIVEVAE